MFAWLGGSKRRRWQNKKPNTRSAARIGAEPYSVNKSHSHFGIVGHPQSADWRSQNSSKPDPFVPSLLQLGSLDVLAVEGNAVDSTTNFGHAPLTRTLPINTPHITADNSRNLDHSTVATTGVGRHSPSAKRPRHERPIDGQRRNSAPLVPTGPEQHLGGSRSGLGYGIDNTVTGYDWKGLPPGLNHGLDAPYTAGPPAAATDLASDAHPQPARDTDHKPRFPQQQQQRHQQQQLPALQFPAGGLPLRGPAAAARRTMGSLDLLLMGAPT